MDIQKLCIWTICILSAAIIVFIPTYYYNNQYIYVNIVSNSNVSIEDAIKTIPICNSHDRPRQEVLLSTLHAWSLFADKHNIRYWIAYGSLVGYVQRGGLLPHDSDTDILMLADDTKYLVPFSDVNFSSIHEIKVHPQWSHVGYAGRSYFPSKGFNFIAPNARFIHRKLRYHVDIWPMYDFDPSKPRKTSNTSKTLTEYSAGYSWISSPMEWTFPLKKCSFSGVKVWCPAMPERLVTNIYGAKAVHQTDKICVNGSWRSG